MAPSRILLSHTRWHSNKHLPFPLYRHPFSSLPSPPSPPTSKTLGPAGAARSSGLPQFLHFARSLSSSAPIKPVSYPVKPKEASPPKEDAAVAPSKPSPVPLEEQQEADGAAASQADADAQRRAERVARTWTREDARYVKDAPVISPVFYPPKVAPLPEGKAGRPAGEGESEAEEGERLQGEAKVEVREELLQRERRRIEANARVRRALLIQQEEDNVPFPTLIKQEKKKPKVALDLQEAIRQVKANAERRFTETVEAHAILGVDPRRGDQMVRGAVTLPHGTGKVVRVAVFAEGAAADEARAAGADIVGGDELIEEIMNGGGKINFDKCIAIPAFMPRLGKIARILGPRGLMPNPKLGSVTSDVSVAVKEAKCGRIDFKIDKTAIVHVALGKVSFSEEALRENIAAFVNALLQAKPVGLKKTSKYAGYLNSFSLCSTMGPGFLVSMQSISATADNYHKLQGK